MSRHEPAPIHEREIPDVVLAAYNPHFEEWFLVDEEVTAYPDGRSVPIDQCANCGGWHDVPGVDPADWEPTDTHWEPRHGKAHGVVRCDCGAEYNVHAHRASEVVFA